MFQTGGTQPLQTQVQRENLAYRSKGKKIPYMARVREDKETQFDFELGYENVSLIRSL